MKIYIAGKISGLNRADAFYKFVQAADLLRRLGHEPVNPMEANGLDDDGNEHPWAEYMRRDIPILLACEAIYLLPCWEDSKGARLERLIAEEIGLLVIHESKVAEAVVQLTA